MDNTGQQQLQQPYANPRQLMYVPQPQAYTQAPRQNAPASNPILRAISQVMEQTNRINSRVEEIEGFVKTNVQLMTDNKKGKVSFSDQLPSQATSNPRNQGALSSQIHNVNHVHIEDKAVESALAISRLRSGKDLSDLYKDHPFHQDTIDEEIHVVVVKQDSDSEDEKEHTKAKPNPDTYKPHVPYPQALNRPKAKLNKSNDHLLEAFQKVTITIP